MVGHEKFGRENFGRVAWAGQKVGVQQMVVRPISTFVKYLTFKIEKQWLPYFQVTFYFPTKFYPTYYIEGGVIFCQDLVR